MTAASNREKYIDKVKKLLAKAEGTTVQAEADAFYAKAMEFIAEWQIADAELTDSSDVLAKNTVNLGTYTPIADFLAMQDVLSAFGLKLAFTAYTPPSKSWSGRAQAPKATIYGFQSDIDKGLLVWASIEVQLASACRRMEPSGLSRGDQRTWRQSFKRGYGRVIRARLNEARETVVTEAVKHSPGVGLVLVSRTDQLEKLFKTETTGGRSTSLKTDSRGVAAGATAARSADLGGTRLGKTNRKALT